MPGNNTQAGGSFVEGGYNATLADNNPLGPRPGWSGNSGGWLSVLVNPSSTAARANRSAALGFWQLPWPDQRRVVLWIQWTSPSRFVCRQSAIPSSLTLRRAGIRFTFDINTVAQSQLHHPVQDESHRRGMADAGNAPQETATNR